MIERARVFARLAHSGQRDKQGRDYFDNHLWGVHHRAKMLTNYYEIENNVEQIRTVAWLHDVLEDTSITKKELRLFFPEHICEAVEILTRDDGTIYGAYITNIISKSLIVPIIVKLADLQTNRSQNSTFNSLNARYDKAIDRLGGMLKKMGITKKLGSQNGVGDHEC